MADPKPIKRGDIFVRPEAPLNVWTVESVKNIPGLPRHAELVSPGVNPQSMLLSEGILLDGRMWNRITAGSI
ncbi:MAG: hypothetical protein V3V55_08915 [Rhodospirillales bacterium]